MILGFGCVERQKRKEIKEFILNTLTTGKSIYDISEEWNKKMDKYDNMPKEKAPERYTKFYIFDNKIHYHHINRRHPFSTDGWALLIVKEPLLIT